MTTDKLDMIAIAREIDQVSKWTPDTLHAAYLKFGSAVVRGCVNRVLLWRISNLVDAAYAAKNNPRHVDEKDIAAAWLLKPDTFDLVSHRLLQQFMSKVFAGSYNRRWIGARRIRGLQNNPQKWQKPLELHLDAFFHELQWTINFWIPFQNCEVDRAALQLRPIDYMATRAFAQYTGQKLRGDKHNSGLFPPDVLAPERVTDRSSRNGL